MNVATLARSLGLSAYAVVCAVAVAAPISVEPAAGGFSWWHALDLRDLDGGKIALSEHWIVLAFLDPECPVANAYLPVLNSLARSLPGKRFCLIGVYADPAVDMERLRKHRQEFLIEFALVSDRQRHLVAIAGVTYSSEVAVLDGKGMVLYYGRIDNRVGENGASLPEATKHDLKQVLDRLASGGTGPFPARSGFGCFLPRPDARP
jgi:hypothetical protein